MWRTDWLTHKFVESTKEAWQWCKNHHWVPKKAKCDIDGRTINWLTYWQTNRVGCRDACMRPRPLGHNFCGNSERDPPCWSRWQHKHIFMNFEPTDQKAAYRITCPWVKIWLNNYVLSTLLVYLPSKMQNSFLEERRTDRNRQTGRHILL